MDKSLNLPIIVGIVVLTTVFSAAAIYRYPGGQASEAPAAVQLSDAGAAAGAESVKPEAPQADEASALPVVEQQVQALGKVIEDLPLATDTDKADAAALQSRMATADAMIAEAGVVSPPVKASSPAENPRLVELRARLQQLQSQH